MKRLLRYAIGSRNTSQSLLLLCFLAIGCGQLPEAEPIILISSEEHPTPTKNFDKCVLSYHVKASGSNIDFLKQTTDSASRIWVRHFPKITFQDVSSENIADIVVEIADESTMNFPDHIRTDLIASSIVKSRSVLQKDETTNRYCLYIRNSENWSIPELTKVLAHQFGRIMGLPTSRLLGDLMHPYLTEHSHTEPSDSDVEVLNNLYPDQCNGWKIRRKAPLAPHQNSDNIYSLPQAFNFPGNDTLYLLWPKRQNPEWGFYKILLSETPSEDIWIESKGITLSASETNRLPVSLFTVSFDDFALVAPGQRFANTSGSNIYRYSPENGRFSLTDLRFDTGNGIFSSGMADKNEGFSYMIDMNNPSNARLNRFSPEMTQNQLNSSPIPFELYTHTVGFYTHENIPCLYSGYAAYFMTAFNQWDGVIFNINNDQEFKQPRNSGNEQSFKVWSINKTPYLIRDNYGWPDNSNPNQTPVDLWELDFSRQAQRYRFNTRPSFRVEGKVLLTTSHNGTGLLFTSSGDVYQYIP